MTVASVNIYAIVVNAFFFITLYNLYRWCRFYLFFAEDFLILTAVWEGILGYLVVLLGGWGKRFDLGVILVKVKFRLWGWSLLIFIAPLLKIFLKIIHKQFKNIRNLKFIFSPVLFNKINHKGDIYIEAWLY